MLGQYPLLEELDSSLAAIVAREPVTLTGAWQPPRRRTYREPGPDGSDAGTLVEVVDVQWTGSLTSKVPIVNIGFLPTQDMLFWSKSVPAALSQPVTVCLTASADRPFHRATLSVSIGGACLPAGPVPCTGDVRQACTLADAAQSTGHLFCLADVHDVSYLTIILPGSVVQTGRNGLWHLRRVLAPLLSPRVRELLMRRRGGHIPVDPRGN